MNNDILDTTATGLFPDADVQKRLDEYLDAALRDAHAELRKGRVAPAFDARKFANELSRFDFADAVEMEELLPWVLTQMRGGNVQITHPRYFGLFNPAPAFPSLLADRIIASFNPQLASAKTSPAAVAMETHTIRQVAHRIGLGAGSAGHFTNSGSEANFTALVCALTATIPAYRESGARAFQAPPAIYISKDAHLTWVKIAHQAGIGRLAVRLIDTDGQGRMSAVHLQRAVDTDTENGLIPVMVVGTAGTTVGGMVDPLRKCASIASDAGAWFHVDAAWGGAAVASEQTRPLLAGIELADSVTIDAHKWFATTMACGMFITANNEILGKAFGITAPFMPPGKATEDPYANSVMWSRRFLGLRLFMNLATVGWQGYGRHIEYSVAMLALLRDRLESTGWKTANPGALGVLCVIPPEGYRPVRILVDELVSSGRAWVSAASFEGKEVVRICITNGRTEGQDIDALAVLLNFHGDAAYESDLMANGKKNYANN